MFKQTRPFSTLFLNTLSLLPREFNYYTNFTILESKTPNRNYCFCTQSHATLIKFCTFLVSLIQLFVIPQY